MALTRLALAVTFSAATVSAFALASATGAAASAEPASPTPASAQANHPTPRTADELKTQINEVLQNTTGGSQTAPNEVTWNKGEKNEVRLLLPVPSGMEDEVQAAKDKERSLSGTLATYYKNGCPYSSFTKWACLYENENFNGVQNEAQGPGNGRLLQFKDTSVLQNLNQWYFQDTASSAMNTTGGGLGVQKQYYCNQGSRIIPAYSGLGGFGDFNDAVKYIYLAPSGYTPAC
ncbi:hypothetical protein [Streptosporangium sp. NPDC000396]|uniref:hypothetical protein n=1 Tax=Streptosporangium sp. NPDC000396 TaxID=3366185 RepID=UPI0036894D51